MSYLVLARKWRPRIFAEVVGQAHVLQALTNALASERLHHAYLFAGTRGVGKTTIARILAKALNCERGVAAEPCGECSACQEIDTGRFVDLIEVDAASRTRVDDTRDILDNVQYAPARGRYKVYLIDEVHMLSMHSFNALLKTLEEPPPHVKFLLATTDPQKLPVTVLSRCLQFNLKKLPPSMIQERMASICDAEEVSAEASALALLARAADGSMRDGLSLLDQAIAYGAGSVLESDTRGILGTVERRDLERLMEALAGGNAAQLLAVVADIDEQFPDYSRLLDEIAGSLQRTAVLQLAAASDNAEGDDITLIQNLATELSPEDVQLYYQVALIGKRDLNLAPDARSGFEMTLLRMLAFRPATSSAGPADPLPVAPQSGKPPKAAVRRQAAKPKSATGPAAATSTQSNGATNIPSSPDWHRLVSDLGLEGFDLMLAGNCAWERVEGNHIFLTLDTRSETLLTPERRATLERALQRSFGATLTLSISTGRGGETPSQRKERQMDETLAQARESIENDPHVQTLKSLFDAQVDFESVRPTTGTAVDEIKQMRGSNQ